MVLTRAANACSFIFVGSMMARYSQGCASLPRCLLVRHRLYRLYWSQFEITHPEARLPGREVQAWCRSDRSKCLNTGYESVAACAFEVASFEVVQGVVTKRGNVK